jgi:DNA repair protein RecN (Recombination protein N)
MLKYLHLKHFTIISELSIEFSAGFTVLTGETGAGKSILIDALEIVLGERADSSVIQIQHDRCEITAGFMVADIQAAQQWLIEQALEEEENECIIRRVINRDGRSRTSINGRPCSLQQVRELGALLIHIHGQNKHSLLMKANYQRQLLDEFAQHQTLCEAVRDCYEKWRKAQDALENSRRADQNSEVQKEWLAFQLQEMERLNLREDEWEQLSQEQQRLAHSEQWVSSCQQVLNSLAEHEESNVLTGLHMALQQLRDLQSRGAQVGAVLGLLEQAVIQIEEASTDVRHYLNTLELDPERLQWVEQRLTVIHDLARKHKVTPENLVAHQRHLQQQLQQLSQSEQYIAELMQQIEIYAEEYAVVAKDLSASRSQAALQLNQKITCQIRSLGIANGEFQVQLTPYASGVLHASGHEQVEFFITTNPGQPLQPLHKIASGGELSRMALAIQVVTVQQHTLPTVIFDEVDVGVGGGTAQIVGQQLRKLGDGAQVLCVTHQPQVAAQGHVHLRVQKWVEDGNTYTAIEPLSVEGRTTEVARMLGGVKITQATVAHAKEMLGVG